MAECKFRKFSFVLFFLWSQDLNVGRCWISFSSNWISTCTQSFSLFVKYQFYLGLGKIKIPWKIVNNGTKQYVIFNYQYFLFVILYENRQYYYPAWSWLIVALFTICCWPSRPTFPFSLRSKGNVERLGQQQIVNWATMSQDRAG